MARRDVAVRHGRHADPGLLSGPPSTGTHPRPRPHGCGLVARIVAAQQSLAPAMPVHRPQVFVMLQAAFIVAIAAVGLISGRWIMQGHADYDVSGIFMICTDAFYL